MASILSGATQDFGVKIILYLRRQDDFIESMYTQTIHNGEFHSFADFMKGYENPSSLKYSRIIGDFAREFGKENLLVRSYHSASNAGLISDFQAVIGTQQFLAEEDENWRTPSYSAHALEIAKQTNRKLSDYERKILRKSLQRVMPKRKNESFSFFSLQERKELLQRFADDNRWVAQNYIFVDVSTAFPPALEEQAKAQSPLTYDKVSSLVVDLLSINQTTRKDHTGLVAAARVALASYPRLLQVVETLLRRG